jgi:hypothetical protein
MSVRSKKGFKGTSAVVERVPGKEDYETAKEYLRSSEAKSP